MASPQPLSTLKQLPLTPSSSPSVKAPVKRSAGENKPVPFTFKKPRLANFDAGQVKTPFKSTAMLPPVIARALTPSTSTVACSSSPPRMSSSPSRGPVKSRKVRKSDGPFQKVVVGQSTPLIFGRHRHRPTESPGGSSSSGVSSASAVPRLAVPKHLHHLINSLDTPATTVFLPRHASHASRVHALVEYLPSSDTARLLVIGQNGLKLNGKRVLSGQTVEVARDEHLINFYGAKVELGFPPKPKAGYPTEEEEEEVEEVEEVEEEETRERLFTPGLSSPPLSPLSPAHSLSDNALSLPPSSPPVAPIEMDIDYSIYTDGNRESSPLSPDDDMDGLKERDIKAEMIENGQSPQPPSAPEGVDLPALLASTVVFSGSSKLSLPDLVKHMLDSQPSLKSHGDENAWNRWCAPVLEDTPMFGKVERHGKDASGRPLLPHYFYNPANDPDTSRAKELGGLVRPLRTVQRAGGKAIDWRPVGSGRRRY